MPIFCPRGNLYSRRKNNEFPELYLGNGAHPLDITGIRRKLSPEVMNSFTCFEGNAREE
jgi:hypothetical protein